MSRKNQIVWWIVTAVFLIVIAALYFLNMLAGMDGLLLCAFYLIIFQIRIKKQGYYDDYISRESTVAINGIFIMLILFTHAHGYMEVTPDNMPIFYVFRGHCRQLVVTTFMFFSGYGVMESIKKKGAAYVKSLPYKRVFALWLRFAIAVCIFLVIALCSGESVTIGRFISALTSWGQIGNSNWYVTAILILYLIAFFAFWAFGEQSHRIAVAFSVLLTFIFLIILIRFRGTSTWCYNTIFCFPAGMIFSLCRKRFEELVQYSKVSWWTSLIVSLLVFLMSYTICDNYSQYWNLFWYQIMCIAFVIFIVVLVMKVKIGNGILTFMGGEMLFSIYILMRAPMNVLSESSLHLTPSVFFVLSVAITFAIAWIFTKLTGKLVKAITR